MRDEELRRRIKRSARNLHNHSVRVSGYRRFAGKRHLGQVQQPRHSSRQNIQIVGRCRRNGADETASTALPKPDAALTVVDDRIQPLSLSRKPRLAKTEGVQIP